MGTELTYNEKMVRKIRAALQSAIESGAQSMSINTGTGGKAFTRYSLEQLREMESLYLSRVEAERASTANDSGFQKPDFSEV